jgi:signal transduction histidine kinase
VDLIQLCEEFTQEITSAHQGICQIANSFEGSFDGALSDESLLRHIVVNLLSNANKYSEPGALVQFRVTRNGHFAEICVEDTGIGILPEDHPRLFRSFMRGSNVGTRPGTGLGLIIVKCCVELHRGTLAFESTPGKGSRFTVSLPMFQPASESNLPALVLLS